MLRLIACTVLGLTAGIAVLGGVSALAFTFADLSHFEHF